MPSYNNLEIFKSVQIIKFLVITYEFNDARKNYCEHFIKLIYSIYYIEHMNINE